MTRIWQVILAVVGAIGAVLAFLLYRKYQQDHVNTVKDALAVAKAEREIKVLDAKREMVEERIETRATDIAKVNAALEENRRKIVEARTGVKGLDADGILAEYRRLGYIK